MDVDVVVISSDDESDDGWTRARARGRGMRASAERPPSVAFASGDAPATPVVLVLVGPSGAGKSTFSGRLPRERWAVANQDTVANGARGTRAQCVRVAREAASVGKHVVIDRCGLSAQQREDFVALARSSSPPCALECVWFDQPTALYQRRARDRRNHPGGVEGDGAVRVVQMQMRRKDNAPPTREEGFRVIRRCRFQEDVDAALDAYRSLPLAAAAVEFPNKRRAAKSEAEARAEVEEPRGVGGE